MKHARIERLKREVDRRSQELIDEFFEHLQQVRARGHYPDQRIIFEGWCIQKIASLQILVEKLCSPS